MLKKLFYTLILLGLAGWVQAQSSAPEMADALRSDGKIYVVVTVLAVIFAAIIIYLFSIDRKLSALEKRINK